jgi:hypothetical protein
MQDTEIAEKVSDGKISLSIIYEHCLCICSVNNEVLLFLTTLEKQ